MDRPQRWDYDEDEMGTARFNRDTVAWHTLEVERLSEAVTDLRKAVALLISNADQRAGDV